MNECKCHGLSFCPDWRQFCFDEDGIPAYYRKKIPVIDITNRHFVVAGKAFPIKNWQVWFMTPFGITTDIEEAIQKCIKADLDPELNVIPTPVAVSNEAHYEIFFARR